MKALLERLYNGIIKENPTFVLMLGMCPTLATTVSAVNGMEMGLATMFVLILSNIVTVNEEYTNLLILNLVVVVILLDFVLEETLVLV